MEEYRPLRQSSIHVKKSFRLLTFSEKMSFATSTCTIIYPCKERSSADSVRLGSYGERIAGTAGPGDSLTITIF